MHMYDKRDIKLFKDIWRWEGAERIRLFLWTAFHNRLPTRLWRSSWSHSSPLCSCCNEAVEDVMHILRDCKYAKSLRVPILRPECRSEFFCVSLKEWGILYLHNHLGLPGISDWSLLWGVAVWKLWNWRDDSIFNDEFEKPPNPAEVVKNSWGSYVHLQQDLSKNAAISRQSVIWLPPEADCVKLNVDGAVARSSGQAGCGGVLRNHRGEWIAGFTHQIGFCSAFEAEEWGILKGLLMAWELGFKRVAVESDAREVITMLNNRDDPCDGDLIFRQIRSCWVKDWNLSFHFIYREGNSVADRLAKRGISVSSFFDSCPGFLRNLVQQELLGLNSHL